MNITFKRFLLWILFLAGCPSSLLAQQATTNRSVILRRDPSKASPVVEHLVKGVRLTLVDATAQEGFYHVKTEDDQVGWVWAKYITVSQASTAPTSTAPGAPTSPQEQCDGSMWNHVYHPQRLIVRQPCISVTGTIVDATGGRHADGVRHEKDGDTHGWLRVGPEFQNLLNAGNISDEGGNLVFEIVCKFHVTQADAKAACMGYQNQVALPRVGSHVRIVGSYVQDTFHAQWMEIHPVTSIKVIP